MSAVAIKACPFCRATNPRIDEIDIKTWAVCCPECGTIGPHIITTLPAATGEKAIELWNARKA